MNMCYVVTKAPGASMLKYIYFRIKIVSRMRVCGVLRPFSIVTQLFFELLFLHRFSRNCFIDMHPHGHANIESIAKKHRSMYLLGIHMYSEKQPCD